MTESTKAKIFFNLALLGVLFAIHPIIRDIGSIGFILFGLFLEIRIFYYAFGLLLFIAVYLYAIEFISYKPVVIAQRVGNVVFAVALLVPPFYGLLWITSWIAKFMVFVSKSPLAGTVVRGVLVAIFGFLGGLFSEVFIHKLNLKDREARVNQLSMEEISHIDRADEMFHAGHYYLSVLEAFRAIESALQRAAVSRQISVRSKGFRGLLEASLKAKIVPQEIECIIRDIRILRNKAAYGEEPISATSARHVLEQTQKILRTIVREVEIGEESEEATSG